MQCDFTFSYHPSQRKRFREGDLVRDWRQRYPQLFDEDDERVLNTEHQRRYHSFEWLSAVLLFESTGYLSLVEKYTTKSHPQKRAILKSLLPPSLDSWLCENESGQPDLFVYEPITKDWFFCEVKGDADRIRDNQIDWTNRFDLVLRQENLFTNGRVRVFHLSEIGT